MNNHLSFEAALDIVNQNIHQIEYKTKPISLFEPISYILSLGGKRVRPALTLLAYDLYKKSYEKVIPASLAIEIFHNFTLLHDDLMDKAEVRRGKPCVHKKWNDNVAIISGDTMLIESFREISKVDPHLLAPAMEVFSKVALEVCCGQQLDMEFETRLDVTIDEYLEMINLKTAVLLAASLQIGAILANASVEDQKKLYEFGQNLGLAFQIMDDLLDVYGDQASFGKKIGGDILCNKKTFMLVSALMSKTEHQELLYWVNKKEFDENEKISVVTSIYNRLNIKEKAEEAIQMYYEKALIALDSVNVDKDKKEQLYQLAESLNTRKA